MQRIFLLVFVFTSLLAQACAEEEPIRETDTLSTDTSGSGSDTPATCESLQAELDAELEAIQSCTVDAECGQAMTGTSCGCTRNLVARTDADTARFYEITETMTSMQCDPGLGSSCDCPPAEGFACVEDRCTWNYTTGG